MALYIVIPLVFIFLVWSIFSARRKYIKKNKAQTRFSFATHALLRSQLVFIVIFAGLMIWSQGYIMFSAPVLVFANLIIGLLTFFLALLVYGFFVKRLYTEKPQNETVFTPGGFAVAQIVIVCGILFGTFFYLNGKSVLLDYVAVFAVATNNAGPVEMLKYDFQKDNAYFRIAKNTNDLALCDKLSDPGTKALCYEQSDPEFKENEKNCSLYTKHGHMEYAQYAQRTCVVSRYVYERFKTGVDIDCAAVSRGFGNNIQIDWIMGECRSFDRLQDIINSGDATKCRGYLTGPLNRESWATAYMSCVGNFVGSTEWKNACALYAPVGAEYQDIDKSNRSRSMMEYAKCSGYEQYEQDNTLNTFRGTPPPYTEEYQ